MLFTDTSQPPQVVLCVECCGRRHTLADATSLENLADAMSAGGVVMGARFAPSADGVAPGVTAARLAAVTASIHTAAGKELSMGAATANPLGSPVASLSWAANHLNSRGLGLVAGQLVIAGAMCKSRDFVVGEPVVVQFDGLGTIRLTVED